MIRDTVRQEDFCISGSITTGTLEHDGIERLATHVFVVNIGAGESHSQRDALAIGQDMPFGAELGAIGGVGACEVPPFGALMLALSSEVQSHSNVAVIVNDMSEVNVDAQLMKNGSASLSRVDERLVEIQNG
jgi:hypothetical protein